MPGDPETPCDARVPRLWGPVPPPPPGHSWESLMETALDCARTAATAGGCRTGPEEIPYEVPCEISCEVPCEISCEVPCEVPVGALVVDPKGRILSCAANSPLTTCDPTAHAEILALRQAAQAVGNYRLGGCTLVVTLEPCLMCAGAIVHARMAGVVFGAADMRAGAVQSCLGGLELPFHNHRVWHYGGVRGEACARLLQNFFLQRR